MSNLTPERLQIGPFPSPLADWQQQVIDLFLTTAKEEGRAVLRIEHLPFKDEPGTVTYVVPLNDNAPTAAPVAAER